LLHSTPAGGIRSPQEAKSRGRQGSLPQAGR
jgi:hypothetical protein